MESSQKAPINSPEGQSEKIGFYPRFLFLISAAVTIATESEKISLFLAAGIVALLIKAPPKFNKKVLGVSLLPAFLVSGLQGPASTGTLAKLGLYFTKVGAIVFGSCLAIVPFLHGGVVQQFHW